MAGQHTKRVVLIRFATSPLFLNKLLRNQLHYLNKYFKVIAIAAPGDDLAEVDLREKVEVKPVKIKREISILYDIFSLINIIYKFKKIKPAIVHTSTPKAGLLGMLAAKFLSIPVRVHTETGLRFETTSGFKRKILCQMHKITYFCANVIVAESDGVKQSIYENRLTKKPVCKIGNGNINGIDLAYWDRANLNLEALEKLRIELNINDHFCYIFIGRLVKDKGIAELVMAFTQLYEINKKALLLMVGNFEEKLDPLDAEIIELIKNHPGIRYVGYKDDVRLYLRLSQILVLPSYREGFPNVVLQALAFEVPCIVTSVHGATEVIEHNKNGLIVPKQDCVNLFNAMLFAINNPLQIEKFKQFTRSIIVSKFSQDSLYPIIVEFYNKLLEDVDSKN